MAPLDIPLRIVKLTINMKLSFRDNIAFLDMLMHYLVNNLVWCSIISWLPVFVATIECGLPILATCIWGGLTLPNLFELLHYQGNMNYDMNEHEFRVLSCMLVHSHASQCTLMLQVYAYNPHYACPVAARGVINTLLPSQLTLDQ